MRFLLKLGLWIIILSISCFPDVLNATNVRDFGAKGDGVTDDYNAIIKAIRSSEDGVLEFPAGQYRITGSLHLKLDECTVSMITGNAGNSSIWMDGPGPAFFIEGTHLGSALPSSVSGTTWTREKFFSIENLEIKGVHPEADGIQLVNLMQPMIARCLIRDVQKGIHLSSRNRNVSLLGNHVYHCSGIGVYLDSVNIHQININDNHISYCKKAGIMVRDSEIRNIQIVGNDIEYNCDAKTNEVSADIFFDISETGSIREGAISSNTIQSVESKGGANINFRGRADSRIKLGLLSITGNHISNQETLIKMRNVKGISITGNTLIRGYQRHVVVDSGNNLIIQGNVFDHNDDYFVNGVTAPGGIRFLACQNVIFSDNIVEGVEWGDGDRGGSLELDQCRRVTVNSCHFVNPKYRGIDVFRSDDVSISGCSIYRESGSMIDGILVGEGCDNLKIDENRIDKTKRGQVFRVNK